MLKNSLSPILVEQYFDLLSISYRRRNKLLFSYQHKLSDLIEWDNNITLYLNALLLLPSETNAYIQEKLSEGLLNNGELFVIALYAANIEHDGYLRSLFTLAQASEEYIPVIQDIVHWVPVNSVFWSVVLHYPVYAVYASAVRTDIAIAKNEMDVSESLLKLKAPILQKIVLQQAYQQDPEHYLMMIESLLDSDNEADRLVAIDSLLDCQPKNYRLFTDDQTLKSYLYQLTQSRHLEIRYHAAKLWVFKTSLPISEYCNFIKTELNDIRLYIQILGWYGSVEFMPELIEWLDNPDFARLSAAAIYTITGFVPEQAGWVGENLLEGKPECLDADGFPVIDQDVALTWPDKTAFKLLWSQSQNRFDISQRYLAGELITDHEKLKTCLVKESLFLSYLAACHLSVRYPALPFFISFPAHQRIKMTSFLGENRQKQGESHVINH